MSSTTTLAVAAMCVALAGLSCEAPRASINDCMGGRARLIAVDGKPVERARSKYVTVIPFARVKAGTHTFRVRMREDESGAPAETLLVSATVVAGKVYRFEERSGALQLTEERREQ
jgi:hypothetical protein